MPHDAADHLLDALLGHTATGGTTPGVALLLTDRDLRVSDATAGLPRVSTLQTHVAVGAPLLDLLPELLAYDHELAAMLADRQPELTIEVIGEERADGSPLWRTLRALPHHGADGHIDGLAVVLQDVSAQVTLEQQLVQAHNDLHLLTVRSLQQQSRLEQQERLLRQVVQIILPQALAVGDPHSNAVVQELTDGILEAVLAPLLMADPTAAHDPMRAMALVCAALDRLGGGFAPQQPRPASLEATAVGHSCPWGSSVAGSPTLCDAFEERMSVALGSRFPALRFQMRSAMGHGADHCLLCAEPRTPSLPR